MTPVSTLRNNSWCCSEDIGMPGIELGLVLCWASAHTLSCCSSVCVAYRLKTGSDTQYPCAWPDAWHLAFPGCVLA